MTDNANKPGDQSGEAFRRPTDKSSENLSKDSPEVNVTNLRAAQKANPNKTDTVSPDGKSRFQLTDDGATKTSTRLAQEQVYKQAGLGDPNEPIGKAKSETFVAEKRPEVQGKAELFQRPEVEKNNPERINERAAAAAKLLGESNVFKGSIYQSGLPEAKPARSSDPERIEIAQAMPPHMKREEVVNALKTGVGELHGIVNFAVNTASGLGDVVRMLGSADRKINPIRSMLPDTDPEGTKKLHETCASVSMGTRVLLQFGSTLNENSPLYGKDFDPEARQVAQNLAQHLPGQLRKELDDFRKAPIEQRAEKGTEFLLDLYTLADTGVIAASKAAQLAKDSKLLTHIGNEMKSLAGKVKDLHEDKLEDLVNFMTADGPQFAYDGPSAKGARREHFGKEEKASVDHVRDKVDRPKPTDLKKLAEHPVVREVLERASKTGKIDDKDGHRVTDIIRESVRAIYPEVDKRNIAFAVLKQNGKEEVLWSVHGPSEGKNAVPGLPIPEKPVLNAYHSGAQLRDRDSEFKIINEIARRLELQQGRINAEILLYSEQKPCSRSCKNVMDDFRTMFNKNGNSVRFPDATWSYKDGYAREQGIVDRYKK